MANFFNSMSANCVPTPYTISAIPTGTTGAYINVGTNSGTVNWANAATTLAPTTFKSTNNNAIMTIPAGEEKLVLEKAATLEVKGNVVINGIDLEERLSVIEKVLQIPTRDATMEAKYPSLKKKFDEYINALEQYKTWDRIKGDDNGTT